MLFCVSVVVRACNSTRVYLFFKPSFLEYCHRSRFTALVKAINSKSTIILRFVSTASASTPLREHSASTRLMTDYVIQTPPRRLPCQREKIPRASHARRQSPLSRQRHHHPPRPRLLARTLRPRRLPPQRKPRRVHLATRSPRRRARARHHHRPPHSPRNGSLPLASSPRLGHGNRPPR